MNSGMSISHGFRKNGHQTTPKHPSEFPTSIRTQDSIRTPDMHSWEALFITQEPVEQAHVGVAAGRWIARAYADEALARRAEDPVLHRIAIAAAGVVVQRAVDFEEMDRPVVTVLVEHHAVDDAAKEVGTLLRR